MALKEENARGVDVRRVDLAEDELDFSGFDGVFHLAAQPGVRSFGDVFPLYLRRNVHASQRVFEAAARGGVRALFASSSSIYGEAERYPTPWRLLPLTVRKPSSDSAMNRKSHFTCRVLLMQYSQNCEGSPWAKSQRNPSIPL